MSVSLSDGALFNTFVKVLVLVHVPGMSKKTLGRHCYRQQFFFCLIVNNFFGSLVNETFSNLKFNVFIITRSIFSNKCVKHIFWLIIAGSPLLELLFGCSTANFGPLSRRQPHSSNFNKCILNIRHEGHQKMEKSTFFSKKWRD